MEERVYFQKKDMDYDKEPDQDWIKYLHENIEHYESWGIHKNEDEKLHAEIVKSLYESKEVDASLIEIDVQSGHVLLTGKVTSEVAKQKAEEIVRQNFDVWSVENQLELADQLNRFVLS